MLKTWCTEKVKELVQKTKQKYTRAKNQSTNKGLGHHDEVSESEAGL